MIEKKKIIKAYVASSKPEEIFVDVIEKVQDLKENVEGMQQRIDEDLRTEPQLIASLQRIYKHPKDGNDGKDGKDGKPGAPGKDGKPGAKGDKGDQGSPDTAEQIIAKIKSVKGKGRLSIYDLAHWEDLRGTKNSIQWAAANGGVNGSGITLTTTGTSGAATLMNGVLNIPQYSGGTTYTFGTGLTNTAGTITVNQSQYITTLSNLTNAGFVQTTSGGVLSSAALTSGQITTALGYTPQTAITLTTTGTSGNATLSGGALNIPNYTYILPTASTSVLGGVMVDGTTITISGGVISAATGGAGTVSSVSVVSANGFAGTVANPTSTPAITITTTITGLLKGNGTAISAATAGTDYQAPITLTTTGTSGAATFSAGVLNIPQYAGTTYTAGTGLTLSSGAFSVNTSQNITTLSNLTVAGLVQTTSSGVLSSALLTSSQVTTALGFTPYNATNPSGYISLTSLSATAPIAYNNTTGVISISQATTSTNGYLSSTDWNTFNGKQGAITLTTTGTSGAATLVGNTLNIPQYAGTTYTFSTGLTNTSGTITVNTTQNITTLSNLTTAGFVQTTSGGVLSSAALTSGQVTTALGYTPFGGTNPLPIANGGTNNTSSGTSGGVEYYNGTLITNSAGFTYDGTSKITLGVSGTSAGGLVLESAGSGQAILGVGSGAIGTNVLLLPTIGGTDTLVSLAATQTITNKTISGSSNTISNIATTSLTGTLQAGQFPALTGDITTTAGSLATTLATVNSNIGSYTYASITVNGKGLITAASNGTAPVNSGTANQIAYYSSTGTVVSGNANVTMGTSLNAGKMTLGVAGTTAGSLVLSGSTSGSLLLANASGSASGTISFPSATDTVTLLAATQTLTNKTLTSPVISTIVNTGTLTLPTSTDTLVGRATTDTLTNKRITKRVLALSAGSATPAINTDNYDVVHITAQNAAITSFTTNLTGTPVDGDTLRISITDSGTAEAITWGAKFASSTVTLPTTTVASTRIDVGFFWDTVASVWRCVAVA